MLDIQYLKQQYFTFDKPIPFKSFYIYPVMLEKYYDFMYSHDILDIDKNSIPDKKIVKMTYLEFLINILQESEAVQIKLSNILNICLKIDLDSVEVKIKDNQLIINGETIDGKDFDVLRKIILYQNIPSYDDRYVDPEIKKLQERHDNIVNKGMDDIQPPTLEDLMIALIAELGYTIEYVTQLSWRKFSLLLKSVEDKIDYKIKKAAEMGGMVTFKEPIEHWIYKKKKDRFANAFAQSTTEDIANKTK